MSPSFLRAWYHASTLVGLRRSAAHRECHAAVPLAGERDDLFEVIDLLELLFDPVQHLVLDLPRVAPGQMTSAVIDGTEKFGIFELAELGEAERSRLRRPR